MSHTITLRIADSVADWLKSSARKSGRSVNDIGASLLEEAKRVSEFAEIEFRTFGGERHACLKGLMQVWQVVEVARQYSMNPERTAQYFGWPVWRVLAAFNYYEAFPTEIDDAIIENEAMGYERLKRLFPHMTLTDVTVTSAQDPEAANAAYLAAEGRALYDADSHKTGAH